MTRVFPLLLVLCCFAVTTDAAGAGKTKPKPEAKTEPAAPAPGQCNANYTLEGSFFKGRVFRTWGVYPGTSQANAFKKVYAEVGRQGFRINSFDKDMGVINAQQDVSMGGGRSVPLTVQVDSEGKGAKVSLSFSTGGGLSVGEDSVKKGFCDILGALEK